MIVCDYPSMGKLVDLTGKTFGLWAVNYRTPGTGPVRWDCTCTGCDESLSVLGASLRSGKSLGCVKCRSKHPFANKPKRDLMGQRFNQLIVVAPSHLDGRWHWTCRCDCGNSTTAAGYDLECGKVKSCGCRRARSGSAHPRWRGHGKIPGQYWSQIKQNAQAREIRVRVSIKEAWRVFQEQEGLCALSGLPLEFGQGRDGRHRGSASLDRIDSGKGYVKGNIQWVHKEINRMKMDTSVARFLHLCRLVTEAMCG